MTAITKIELNKLIADLEKNPYNLDLINKIAIGYFENYELKSNKEDFDYFEKAYKLKKTIKSTHNFAWFLYFEWSEIEWRWNEDSAIEKALKIQKESIELYPKSYLPYYQYGYMLLDQKRYYVAIPFLQKANNIKKDKEITHNIGFCYFQIEEYQKAYDFFNIPTKIGDIEDKRLFNLGLTAFKLNKLDQVKSIAEKLLTNIKPNTHKDVSGYKTGLLFYLIGDYQLASTCLFRQGINGINLFEWPYLCYSLYLTDKKIWENNIYQSIDKKTAWIKEIENDHEDWKDYTTKEKQEQLVYLKSEIESRKKILSEGMAKPNINLSETLLAEYCGCLLFDCSTHKNIENDE